jgi:Mn2+/Fe2+ NRAMP family transporter
LAHILGRGQGQVNEDTKTACLCKFYAVMAVAMALGLVLNFVGFNAVKMLFWSAVINGLLAPPLILLVILLTSSRKVMGKRVNSPLLKYLGWATFVVMTAAAAGMIITS